MKKILPVFTLLLAVLSAGAYNDHRGFNLDSLERVVARWTPDRMDRASEAELLQLNRNYRDLMLGWQNLNSEKCRFYARKALEISVSRGWEEASADAYRYVGQMFYGEERYDSAAFYYKKAMESVLRIEDGKAFEDMLSSLYGTLGNLYNMMGDIPSAMDYYAKAGEIFERNGWNESNTVLWYNIGETWMDEGDRHKAASAYEKAASYAKASGDSLMLMFAYKGLGRLYMESGRTSRALRYLRDVNAYYSVHPDDSPVFRRENLEFIDNVLTRQKRQLHWIIAALASVLLLIAGFLTVLLYLRKTKREKTEANDLIRETLEEMKPQAGDVKLSSREREVLDLLSKGYTAPMIAKALGLSPETIRWYRQKLLVKLDVSNTAELISITKEMGII